jgi:hypothetical protein
VRARVASVTLVGLVAFFAEDERGVTGASASRYESVRGVAVSSENVEILNFPEEISSHGIPGLERLHIRRGNCLLSNYPKFKLLIGMESRFRSFTITEPPGGRQGRNEWVFPYDDAGGTFQAVSGVCP